MRISRIYTPQPLRSGTTVELDASRSHYIGKVLRLQPGAELCAFNGDGHEYPARITTMTKKAVSLTLGDARTPATESSLHTVLGLGISRGERMDYAVQKSTELGVSRIVPLFTFHCEVKLSGERLEKRLEHWRQIAISACEQSGRVRVPEIGPAAVLKDWLREELPGLKLLFDHREAAGLPATKPADGVALLIGPEGGLAEEEMLEAGRAGFQGIALGNRILRTETAPVAALSVLQYLWG